MGLQVCGRLDDIGGSDHPSQSPACHRIGFCYTIDQDALVLELGDGLHNGQGVIDPHVIDQVLVNLIRDHPDVVLKCPLANGLGFLWTKH